MDPSGSSRPGEETDYNRPGLKNVIQELTTAPHSCIAQINLTWGILYDVYDLNKHFE